MSVAFTQTSGADYTPKYLFVSGDRQRGTGKSRHVMKEFLRKRDSARLQKQLVARSQSRVLPWLRREDMEQSASQTVGSIADAAVSSDSSSESSSRPSSPHQSQWTGGSTFGESPPTFSSAGSVFDYGGMSETSRKSLDSSKDLVDNCESSMPASATTATDFVAVHDGVISQLYGTRETTDSVSPASVTANHIMTQPVASRILLAVSSLNRDIEGGHLTPSGDTLALVVAGIGLLQQQIQRPNNVSDDTVLAVLTLWAYEVTLSMGLATEKQAIPKTLTKNIQTHLTGLQRLIKCRGGLRNLSSESLWLLAWCVSTMPGYSRIETRMMESASNDAQSLQSGCDGYYCLSRLFDTLSNIQRNMSSPDSIASILDESAFVTLKKTLLRLNTMRRSFKDQKTPMSRLRKSTALTATLLFIFDVLLGGTDRAHQEARGRRKELLRAQQRLADHRLDEEGSFEKVWSVVMTQQEVPLRLHPRAWSIVEMANVIKHLNVPTIDALSQLLLGYLLPETRDHGPGTFRYERLLLQIHFELDGLADLG